MLKLSPFPYASHRDYLDVVRAQYRSKRGRPYTFDQWSSRLGYRSARSVAMVIKGQRLPSTEMIGRLTKELGLNHAEHRYLELLVQLARNQKLGKEIQPVLRDLQKLNPNQKIKTDILKDHQFTFLADWFHFAILQLVGTPDFKEDSAWIRRRLRNKVSVAQVTRAIDTLLSLGVLVRDKQGDLDARPEHLRSSTETDNHGAHLHLQQMSERALEALREQRPSDREFDATTFRLDPKRIPEAKAAIRQFRNEFISQFHAPAGEEVFQINVQLFAHTNQFKGNGEKE